MTTTTLPIEEGALVRLTRDIPPARGDRARDAGLEFTIEDYVSAEEAEDGEAFYWGSLPGNMNGVVAPADAVEVVKTAAQMAARTIPTPAQIAEHVGGEALGFGHGDFEFDEADYGAKDGTVELYGKTRDGLPFMATLRVIQLEETDF